MLTVGMALYACEEEDADILEAGRPLDKNWFLTRKSAGMSIFINSRSVTCRTFFCQSVIRRAKRENIVAPLTLVMGV